MPAEQPTGPIYGAETVAEEESDAREREERGDFVGKYTTDRMDQLFRELKPTEGQRITPEIALKLQEYNRLLMRAQEQRRKYPGRSGPLNPAQGTTQDKKGDKWQNPPQRLDGPKPQSKLKEAAIDVASVPAAAFHALAMRPYFAAKTLLSPVGQYRPGEGDVEGVALGNQAAGALAAGSVRGGGGLGVFGGKGPKPVENIESVTAELQKVTEAIAAATQHLNALGAKKSSGGFGAAEFESARRIQQELPALIQRGKLLENKIKRAASGSRKNITQQRQYGYDPATKKPGAHATGLPAPDEQTLEQFQAQGNV
jgi:hypothetical protein